MSAPLFVLVHSPLVGPLTWGPVAAELRGRGYAAVVPALRAGETADPPYWRQHVAAAVAALLDLLTRLGVDRAPAEDAADA